MDWQAPIDHWFHMGFPSCSARFETKTLHPPFFLREKKKKTVNVFLLFLNDMWRVIEYAFKMLQLGGCVTGKVNGHVIERLI